MLLNISPNARSFGHDFWVSVLVRIYGVGSTNQCIINKDIYDLLNYLVFKYKYHAFLEFKR